ncbi:Alkaline/neutral invertase [Forsythia ovata]|uniref:Alkaline/neutral invertase n=1 Tax=Forsythia ovata TaxID=205694 RepID=A0ABD1NTW6_9LAMI
MGEKGRPIHLGAGVMPASFKVLHDPVKNYETIIADFGECAIGRVAPIDLGFWWIILLCAYTKSTGDTSLAELPECQRGIRLILTLCLSEAFDTFPTLLCADGCCMIDRRMGVYEYPIEIQALFFMALRCALYLLKNDDEGKECADRISKRLHALSYHMRSFFWLDIKQLNDIYRYKTEEYSHTAVNKFNVMPDSLPDWVFDFMPTRGGYFIGNVSPARMDFRWFCLSNCIAILSSLATPEQASAIMDLIESRWEELVGEMPLKICYPAMESHEWRIVTVLLWLLTAACIKSGRPQLARRATELAEARLLKDHWPEYYDGKLGRYIGKQARKNQTCCRTKTTLEGVKPSEVQLQKIEPDWTPSAPPGHPDVRAVIPRREDLPTKCGVLIVSAAMHKQKSMFFFLMQTDYGDIFKVMLDHDNDRVKELKIKHIDTIPVTSSLCILKSGFLFAASEFGNHALYQFQSIGDDPDVEASSDTLMETKEGFQPVFFQPRKLKNLVRIDQVESLMPMMDMKVINLFEEETPHFCVSCIVRIFVVEFDILKMGLSYNFIFSIYL